MNRKPELLFEKFEIETVIKKDAYSAVYLARHIFLGKRIFLKTLNTKEIGDAALLHRFKREARILAHLEHPNIIKVLDFGTFGDRFYISFEYFESRNLRYWLSKGLLTDEEKERLLIQLARALHFAHRQGVVHRDLKPENILINEQRQLKIADFGLALWNNENQVTEASSIVGTPAYMAPEQIRGEKLTPQTDLFNLGLIVFELFKGKNPFLGREVGQTLNNILNFDEGELRREYEDLPEHIVKILDGLLRKQARERFASAEEILRYLPIDETQETVSSARHTKSIVKAIVLIALPLFLLLAVLILLNERTKKPASLKESAGGAAVEQSAESNASDTLTSPVRSSGPETTVPPKAQPQPKEKRAPLVATATKSPSETAKPALPAATNGTLWIECLPWAQVTIDSALTVTTPLKQSIDLKAGPHHLVFRHPAFPRYETTVRIKGGETQRIAVKLDTLFGYLDCQVFPWGKIFVDGRLVDVSPLKKPLPLPPGKHVLRVENPAFAEYDTTLIIVRKDTSRIRVRLLRQ